MRRELPDPDDRFLRDLSFGDLRTILAVAEMGSFRRAAVRLGVGQSMVSRRVQKLEDELGVSLFERSSSGTRLTVAGRGFICSCRTILQQAQTAFADARSAGVATTGRLRIGLVASISEGGLRKIVEAFAMQHPYVDLSFFEGDRSDVYTRLSHRRIDVLFALGEPRDDDPETMLVGKERIYLALPAKSSKAKIGRLSWRGVANDTFLVGTGDSGDEIQNYILRSAGDSRVRVAVRRMDLGREGIMTLVGLGFGVSVVSEHWRGVSYPGVSFVPLGEEDERLPFLLTWRRENDNPALRRFLSLSRMHARGAILSYGLSQTHGPSP
nr:LysR family transcriptional regulator [Palleronia pontilimi]